MFINVCTTFKMTCGINFDAIFVLLSQIFFFHLVFFPEALELLQRICYAFLMFFSLCLLILQEVEARLQCLWIVLTMLLGQLFQLYEPFVKAVHSRLQVSKVCLRFESKRREAICV